MVWIDFTLFHTVVSQVLLETSRLTRIHADESLLASRKGREDRKGKSKSYFEKPITERCVGFLKWKTQFLPTFASLASFA